MRKEVVEVRLVLRCEQLGRGARGRRAHVSHESAMVKSTSCPTAETTGTGLPHGAHHRLFVEGPEVLAAAAAAGDDDHVHVRLLEPAERAPHLVGRAVSLHPRVGDQHREPRVAPVQHLAGSRASAAPVTLVTTPMRRGRNGSGRGGRVALARPSAPRRSSFCLELLEGQGLRAHSLGLDALDDQAVAALRLVDVEVPLGDDLSPSFSRNLRLWPAWPRASRRWRRGRP